MRPHARLLSSHDLLLSQLGFAMRMLPCNRPTLITTNKKFHIATNARTRAHAHTHAHVRTRTRTHARARMRTCPRARTHAETLSFRLEIIPKQSAATDPTNGSCVDVLIATLFHLPQVRLLPFWRPHSFSTQAWTSI